MEKTDFLIIGSGVAGLSLAIKLSTHFPDKTVAVVTKSNEDESNTKYAQGGIAIVTHINDSYHNHIADTLVCGDGLCDTEVVDMVIKNGPQRLKELMDWGARFDLNSNNELDLGKEGGHSDHRVVHHKDQTGFEIERAVLAQAKRSANITILDYHFALDLIVDDNNCLGVYVLSEKSKSVFALNAAYTVLASGGIGQVYGHTTNPLVATGDGIAMAKRAKANIMDMEFVQFHPTALYNSERSTTFLISEAVRGFGAYLKTKDGQRFMLKYDPRGELASRDIVSQSIDIELKKSGEKCVYMDCTHLDQDAFAKHFPMITQTCNAMGIDLAKDWIPVAPSQHYICGGIAVNTDGQTSIKRLFACGECSRTGLHGANRLASNSLLEALVYSNRIYNYLVDNFRLQPKTEHLEHNYNLTAEVISAEFIKNRKKEVQKTMLNYAGIVRNNQELALANKLFKDWHKQLIQLQKEHRVSKDCYELKNMIDVGLLIINHSLNRVENKGVFIKTEQPLRV
ncbi:MAG TPA: L-aspartate oxidase [Flavobacterium sp.]|nr:L-aspartate oxidase [Flavobacterium sp.]